MPSRSHQSSLWLALLLLLAPMPAFAVANPASALLIGFIETHIYGNAIYIFSAVAGIILFVYGARLVVESLSESAIETASKSFLHALFGFAVIALIVPFANAFVSGNPLLLRPGLIGLGDFVFAASGGIFTLLLTANALRLITSQGDSGATDTVRKSLISNVAGILLIIFANVIFTTATSGDMTIAVTQIEGFINYLLTIIGAMSVIALMGAGFMLIVSVDESLKDRAKKTIIGTLVTLAIVMACYTLILTFL